VRNANKPYRLSTAAILSGTLMIAACQCSWAQVATSEEPGSSALENAAAASSIIAEGSSSSQTESQAPKKAGPGSVAATRARCDLISAPLTCISDISRDQAGIWTAPARLRGRKLLWLLPFAAATTLAFEYDVQAMNALGPSATRVRVSNDFTHVGSGYVLAGAAAATYLFGKLEHKDRPREAGMLALESLADATLVVEGLKLATNRQRPYVPPGTGKFWPDDTDIYSFSSSFPSGHAAATFAVARVIVEETPGHPWVHVVLYGLATGVAIARVTGENHFPSDALVGSVIGYSVGGYVYHHHSAFYSPKSKSVRIEPLYNPATASYGLTLSIKP
jgi:membrane-associated phospholipid phosphatase